MPLRPFPMNAWYAAAWDVDVKRDAVRAHGGQPEARALSDARRNAGGARGRVLAPAAAALDGPARGRRVGVRLSRPGLQPAGPLHLHAVAGHDQSVGLRPQLPGRRASPLPLGMAGRSGTRRPRARPRPALERRFRVGRRRQDDPRELRLPARPRQPDGPDPRNVRPRLVDRQPRSRRSAVRRNPRQSHGDGDPLDERHRSAAVLGVATSSRPRPCRQGRSLADHPLRGALHDRDRRRRCARRQWSARRRPQPRRQRLRAEHDHARDRSHVLLLLGVRAQLQPERAAPDDRPCARALRTSFARTSTCWKHSSGRSTSIPITCSTTSTSTPARCGRAG